MYALIFEPPVAEAVADLPEEAHDLYVLACVDLVFDPYGRGVVHERRGPVTALSHALGGMGLILYEVDEEARTVTIGQVFVM